MGWSYFNRVTTRENYHIRPVYYLPLLIFSGASEVLMANAILVEATKTPGKEAVAMESFARGLLHLPTTIADNAGYDSAQLISELRAAHSRGQHTYGLGDC